MPQISLRSTLPGLVVFLFLVLLFPGLFSSLLPRFSGFLPGLGSLLWIKRLNSGRLNDRLWCRGQWRNRSSTDVDVYGGPLLGLPRPGAPVGGATGGRTAVFAVLPSGTAGSGGSGAAISAVVFASTS